MKSDKVRYGLLDNNRQVAEELGVTEQGATYIKNVALTKAKALLEKKGFKPNDFFEESKDE